METAFFITVILVSMGCIWLIYKMISNKLKGKDELDGVLDFKKASERVKEKNKYE